MEGYEASTYGDRFADVYDDWYGSITDTDACVETVSELAREVRHRFAATGNEHLDQVGDVLELGVGTGRLAIPLAVGGLAVTGVDSSPAMLEALRAKSEGMAIEVVSGDMADLALGPDRRWTIVLIAYNTLFNLVGQGDQERCLRSVAQHLAPGGRLVVEAFVPDTEGDPTDSVVPKHVTADKVVLSVSRSNPATGEVIGQYVDITETGIRLRPWHIRWASPSQLDTMTEAAGLVLVDRWSGWDRAPFDENSPVHISTYQRSVSHR